MQINKKRLLLWIAGFAILFLFNVFVEVVVLTYLDLHNTDKNDIYFQLWWIVVGIWLLFGYKLLGVLNKSQNLQK